MSPDHSYFGASLLLPLSLRREPPPLLDSIDDILERPLLSLHNPLLAEDEDVPDIDFALFGPHYSIIEDDTLLKPERPPRQIDDELVTRMKRPIDLPDENYQPDYSADDCGGLVDATSAMTLSCHDPVSSPCSKHHERAPTPDARYGSTRYNGALFSEPPDTPRRPRFFGHTRH